MTRTTFFTVQYEMYGMRPRTGELYKVWVDGLSYDTCDRAIHAMAVCMSDHAFSNAAYKYGEHRVVRRTTTVVDEPLHFPQPDESADRVTLATPLKMLEGKLSTRLYNVLRWSGPSSGSGTELLLLAHVVACDPKFWLRQPNMGSVSLAELETFLRDNGLPALGTLPVDTACALLRDLANETDKGVTDQ